MCYISKRSGAAPASCILQKKFSPDQLISGVETIDKAPEQLALVLDLDECLIHTKFSHEAQGNDYKDSFEITLTSGERAVVNKRPGLDEFLTSVATMYDVYLFSAGEQTYVEEIVKVLDPEEKLVQGLLHRDNCTQKNGWFLKDLKRVRCDLSRIILVDNNPISFLLQPQNGIPVPSFFDNVKDRSLDRVLHVLKHVHRKYDVRPTLHSLFNLTDLLSQHREELH